MKPLLTLFFASLFFAGFAQKTKQDLTKDFASADRKEIIEVLKQKLKPDLKQKPKMVVEKMVLKNGFAFFMGRVKDSTGKDIDFRKTVYKEYVKEGIFDGDGTVALLKKIKSRWKVLTYVIGPTDVPWVCWWKEFNAPKEIIDYSEKNCD